MCLGSRGTRRVLRVGIMNAPRGGRRKICLENKRVMPEPYCFLRNKQKKGKRHDPRDRIYNYG